MASLATYPFADATAMLAKRGNNASNNSGSDAAILSSLEKELR